MAKNEYIRDLTGEGSRLYGGRWNEAGSSMLYFCEHLSLCVLELLARNPYGTITSNFSYLEVELPESGIKTISKPAEIFLNWNIDPPPATTQTYGTRWLERKETVGLRVPSAILCEENNILINPNHHEISGFKVVKVSPLLLDHRVDR